MNELPSGWNNTTIVEVCSITMGQSPPSSTYNKNKIGLPFYQGKSDFGLLHPTPTTYCSQPKKIVYKNDILLSVRAPVGPTNICTNTSCIGRGLSGIRYLLDENSKFVFYFFRHIEKELSISGTGSTFTAISKSQIENLQIPLPPLPEQKRIVAKLDKLLTKVDAAKARLDKIPQTLKRFRQSVLSAAVSGELTKEWREKNKIDDEWEEVSINEIGKMNRGISKHRPRNAEFLFGGKYPFIQTGDISQSNGRIISHRQTYSEEGLRQSRIWPEGTVCITIAANIAESAILTYPACFPDSVVGVITNRTLCIPEFFEFYIRTIKNDLSTLAPATAQKNINISILNEIRINLPSLPEQKEIVRRVEELFKFADQIEARYNKAKQYVDKLTQSILAKAFRGELVPQDPNDPPAEELLEKIKLQKAGTTNKIRNKSRRADKPTEKLLERIKAKTVGTEYIPSKKQRTANSKSKRKK